MAKFSTLITVALLLLNLLLIPSQSETIHDLLPSYGLPPGLLPSTAFKSYSLNTDNEFCIELASTSCYVHFSSDLVYYGNKITGKLSYGRLTDITGVQAKKFFLWVPITEMIVHPADNTIEFHSGFLSEARPMAEFKEVLPCKSSVGGCRGVDGILKEEVLAVAERLLIPPTIGHNPTTSATWTASSLLESATSTLDGRGGGLSSSSSPTTMALLEEKWPWSFCGGRQ